MSLQQSPVHKFWRNIGWVHRLHAASRSRRHFNILTFTDLILISIFYPIVIVSNTSEYCNNRIDEP